MNRQSERTNSRRKPRFPRMALRDLRRQADKELCDAEDSDFFYKQPPRKS